MPQVSRFTFVKVILCLLLIAPMTSGLHAQSFADSSRTAVHPLYINYDITITGELSDPSWELARPVSIRYEVEPNDQVSAPVHTTVKILYSQKNLYIGFIADDPEPQKIRAHITDRDDAFADDFVGFILDPFDNNQHAYELFVNPMGIQMDGMRTDDNEDMNFDALWYSEGSISDSGYTAVMKIPFKSLSFPNRDIQHWSIQFVRIYPRNSRYQLVWTHINNNNSCLLCQNGMLTDMRGVKNSHTVEFLPYAMSYQSSTLNDPEDPSSGLDNRPLEARVGGSVSYTPNSSTSLNAVVNPDFSQVETDATQISANETFALYYPEKRPFFMKGADLFTTPEELFYSRMINNPLAAGKVTQNTSRYSLALLTAYDRDTPYIIPGLLGSSLVTSGVHSYSNILRGKYNIGSESYVGGLLTTRNQESEASNYVGSIDWRVLLADHYYFSGQVGYSDTKELNDTTLFDDTRTFGHSSYNAAFNGEHYGGTLLGAELAREAKYYRFSLNYTSFSPTFQSQGGFINKTDRRQLEFEQGISYYPDRQWLTRGGVSMNAAWRYDFSGQFQERYIYAEIYNNFGAQTDVTVAYLPLNDERYRGQLFTGMHRLMLDLDSDALNALSFGGHVETGRYIHRTDEPSVGQGYNFSAYATIKPTARLQIDLNYDYSILSALKGSENFYSGNIVRLNSRYNFSRHLFARFITQYDSFEKQIQVYPLIYYKLNPFTIFYAGMTDYLERNEQENRFNAFKQTDRIFFVKLQYLIRS